MIRRTGIRKKSDKSKKNTGKINSKEIKIDGIVFKSNLEAYCYKELKKTGLEFKYEPVSFVLQKEHKMSAEVYKKTQKSPIYLVKTNSNRSISYTPDFVIYKDGVIVFIIETKGFANEQFALKVKMFYKYCSEHIKTIKAYFLPSNQKEVDFTIKIILEKYLSIF